MRSRKRGEKLYIPPTSHHIAPYSLRTLFSVMKQRLLIDVMSTIFCLSLTEPGRSIRRRLLSSSGTMSLTGGTGLGAASCPSVLQRQVQLTTATGVGIDDRCASRRAGWSSRRSFSSSELIGRRQINYRAAAVAAGAKVGAFKQPNTGAQTSYARAGAAEAFTRRRLSSTEPQKTDDEQMTTATTTVAAAANGGPALSPVAETDISQLQSDDTRGGLTEELQEIGQGPTGSSTCDRRRLHGTSAILISVSNERHNDVEKVTSVHDG